MKSHTQDFKEALIQIGRELKGTITYGNTTLEEEIMAITPHFEANLLKSTMKQLDLQLTVDIPKNTVINCQIGIMVGNDYEMLNFGNYIVYSSERQEDTNSYKIICYDKMLYAMKQNKDLGITYPITIKNYLTVIGNKIGLSVANVTFYNQDMIIPSELYLDLEYTYRDILDEIAQATGSIIYINQNDEIEVKYPTITGDTIDEDYLKDVNVDFKEKYGPINSIVLSRAGESDNVYLRDETSVSQNGLCEIKIVDNQIMNFNNRSDFLQGILNALNGLYYYINDFNSIGILYYDVGDLYTVHIGENNYQCLMLNDEIDVTTGIEEIVYTEMPEQGETDYEKADKTDRRINQTYLIVDKQNQTIESVVSNVAEQNNKISQITQTVDEINSKIQDIADITTYGESDAAYVELEDINESEPIMIKVHPTAENISYLYPRENLYPSDLQYLPNRRIRFTRTYDDNGTIKTQNIDYELPDDLLRYDSDTYDEFYLDYDSQTCQVIKRCGYNADGTVRVLDNAVTTNYSYPQILLGDGDYRISLLGYTYGYLYVRLMAQNMYTTQFATKAEVSSEISQTAQEINIGVNQTLTNYSTTNQMTSAINLKADEITSEVSNTYETKSNANTNYSRLTQTANNISSEVSTKVGNDEVISKINQSAEAITIDANKINLAGKTIDMTSDNIKISSTNFNVDKNGNVTANSLTSTNATITGGKISLAPTGGTDSLRVISNNNTRTMAYMTENVVAINNYSQHVELSCTGTPTINVYREGGNSTTITNSEVTTPKVTQTSLESEKKNFEKLENALNIIRNIDIYKYNLKTEQDETKKHIGFVIGDKFNYSKEVTSAENDGVDIYSFISICCKAIQEQQKQIEQMKKEIEELKGGRE